MGNYYQFRRGQAMRPDNQLTKVILGLTVAVTLIQFFDESKAVENSLRIFLPDYWTGDYWQIMSVTLVHGNAIHLAMNCYALWIMGTILEPMLGKRNFLLLYVASALGGSITIIMVGDLIAPTVGASGAIFGLFGAIITYLYGRLGSFAAVWQSQIGRQLLILLMINVFISFMPGISAEGHFGGLAVGGLIGYLLERKQSNRLAPGEKIGAIILGLLILGLSVYSTMPVHRGAYWVVKSSESLDRFMVTGKAEDYAQAREHFEKVGSDIDTSDRYLKLKAALRNALYMEESQGVLPVVNGSDTPPPAN